jgi:hypothetical protein
MNVNSISLTLNPGCFSHLEEIARDAGKRKRIYTTIQVISSLLSQLRRPSCIETLMEDPGE